MTRRNDIVSILILLAAGLLAGCAGKNEPEQRPQDEIALRGGVARMQRRAPGIDTDTELRAQDIRIDAYFHGSNTAYLSEQKLHYTGGEPAWQFWNGSSQLHFYWPIEGSVYDPADENLTDVSLDFVGTCPYTKPAYIGALTYDHALSFTCDMSSYMSLAAQADMQEYVVAVLNSQTLATQTAAGGALPMSFKHPLAMIKFTITAASGTHVQINSITIEDLCTAGTCRYDGSTMTWTALSGAADMTLAQVMKNGGTTETDPFIVIPNSYVNKYLKVNATWDDWSDVTISDYGTEVNFVWEPGHIYTYNLTLDKLGLKVDVQKFTEQW